MNNDLTAQHLAQEVTVTLPLGVVLRIADQSIPATLVSASALILSRFDDLPAIGAEYGGGMFAGITVHENAPAALVLLPGSRENVIWSDAKQWAGEQGGELPSRFDQLALFKNLKREFAGEWYWSGEQSAGTAYYAWAQGFHYGDQLYYRKDLKVRARAVRRLVIR